jgi:DNA-binding CsgD family transcriptional regulator
MDGEHRIRLELILVVALVSIVIGGGADLVLDRPGSWLSLHVLFESLLIVGALLMAITLWVGWWRSTRSVDSLRRALEARKEERDRWRTSAQDALDGLARAIDTQFAAWDLTPAEREVGLLLLKGHSHKAIAKETKRSPNTVRQHSAALYGKAGLSGRAELSAYFLEDLLLPRDARVKVGADGEKP